MFNNLKMKQFVMPCDAGVVQQELGKHADQGDTNALSSVAQVMDALTGLLKHAKEDLKVLDMLKLLDPLGVFLSKACTPGQQGEFCQPLVVKSALQVSTVMIIAGNSTVRWPESSQMLNVAIDNPWVENVAIMILLRHDVSISMHR